MSIVTLLTDYGLADHYVSTIKARILRVNPSIQIIDISHHVPTQDINHAAFVLKAVFREFPIGTVHLVGVESMPLNNEPLLDYIAIQLEDHFFVGANTGLFSLISESTPKATIHINKIKQQQTTFPEAYIMASAVARLASGVPIAELGIAMKEPARLISHRILAQPNRISGTIIHIDHFGNCISNISKEVFNEYTQDKLYVIRIGGYRFSKIHSSIYEAKEGGNCFIIFNSQNLLEFGQLFGNASELLGIQVNDPVIVEIMK